MCGDYMKKKIEKTAKFDYRPLGKAMRDARTSLGWTQEETAEKLHIQPNYYQRIEAGTENHHPSLDLLYKAARLFGISIDQYFFPEQKPVTSSSRRRLETLLDEMDEYELVYMESNARALLHLREERKKGD